MTNQQSAYDPEPISDELDTLSGALIDYSLDILSEGAELSVSLAAEDGAGNRTLLTFDDEEIEECLQEAHDLLQQAAAGKRSVEGLEGVPVRYALAYDGAVEEEDGQGYEPALIVEFGEHGMTSAYSAYMFYRLEGNPQEFMWTEPAAAGQLELLV